MFGGVDAPLGGGLAPLDCVLGRRRPLLGGGGAGVLHCAFFDASTRVACV